MARRGRRVTCWKHVFMGITAGMPSMGLQGDQWKKEVDASLAVVMEKSDSCPKCQARLTDLVEEVLTKYPNARTEEEIQAALKDLGL